MRVIGIDPGVSGAIAVLEQNGTLIDVSDLPVARADKLSWIDGGTLLSYLMEFAPRTDECHAIIERAQPMPGQGISSSFQYGCGFGSLLAICQARGIAIRFVAPGKWKRECNLAGANKRKTAALEKARLLWPTAELHLAKHHGRAEALLIAGWHLGVVNP